MKIKANYTYSEGYLPTKRHKKLQYRGVEGYIEVEVKEVEVKDAPVILRVVGPFHDKIDYRQYNGKFYIQTLCSSKVCGGKGLYPIEQFIRSVEHYDTYGGNTKEEKQEQIKKYVEENIIIDNVVWNVIGEPRYVINFFGLGHNHGGTGIFLENSYNSNISKNNYFNAKERQKAIEFGKMTALKRGDTESIDMIGRYCDIEVLIPEMIKCNPQLEHGEGSEFINSLEKMINVANSVEEAELLVIAKALAEIAAVQ